jgi:hypothetical protein
MDTAERAVAWLRRFVPAWFVRDDESTGWVTDRFRAHRAPAEVLAWLDEQVGYRLPSGVLADDGDRLGVDAYPGPPLGRALSSVPWSHPVRPWLVHAQEGRVVLVTGDLQTITVNHEYYRQARADGVVRWTGTIPERPVFGYDDADTLLVVLAPMRQDVHRTISLPYRRPSS